MSEKKYSKDHEWIVMDGETGTVGISDYAQQQLGDVVYVELPAVGKKFDRDDEMATVESVKAASEVYAPVGGEVIEINEALDGEPSLVNSDPEGDGWFVKIKVTDTAEFDSLMSADEYKTYVEGLS